MTHVQSISPKTPVWPDLSLKSRERYYSRWNTRRGRRPLVALERAWSSLVQGAVRWCPGDQAEDQAHQRAPKTPSSYAAALGAQRPLPPSSTGLWTTALVPGVDWGAWVHQGSPPVEPPAPAAARCSWPAALTGMPAHDNCDACSPKRLQRHPDRRKAYEGPRPQSAPRARPVSRDRGRHDAR